MELLCWSLWFLRVMVDGGGGRSYESIPRRALVPYPIP